MQTPQRISEVARQPPRKRAHSTLSVDESQLENESKLEKTREERRRDKNKQKDQSKAKQGRAFKKSAPVIVGTGKSGEDKGSAYKAAPRNVFVSRTDRSTTKEIV